MLIFHAPHEQWGVEVREKFFKQLAEVAALGKNAKLITLGDVNGQIGSIRSQHIGTYAPHTQSSNGTLYHNFLKAIQAFVPSTFAECAEGNQVFTYKNQRRIDFASAPLGWKPSRCSAGACPIVDTMALEEDHVPVFFNMTYYMRLPPPSGPSAGFRSTPCQRKSRAKLPSNLKRMLVGHGGKNRRLMRSSICSIIIYTIAVPHTFLK